MTDQTPDPGLRRNIPHEPAPECRRCEHVDRQLPDPKVRTETEICKHPEIVAQLGERAASVVRDTSFCGPTAIRFQRARR